MYKVLRSITRLCVGGPTIHVSILSSKLDKTNFKSKLVCGVIEPHETDMSYVATEYGITPRCIKTLSREISFFRDIFALIEMIKIIRKEKPDIVHTHLSKSGIARIVAWLCRVPVIVHTYHGNIYNGYFTPFETRVFVFIDRILASLSAKIIAISELQKSELISLSIAPAEKIVVIPLGFDFERIVVNDSKRNQFRSKFNIPASAKVVSIVGRVTHIKNHSFFLQIAEQVLERNDDVYFMVVGDGDLLEDIKQKATNITNNDRIIFTGMIKDMGLAYSATDAVMLTSINEGTPVALIEAMSKLKVVFSTNVGGISDFIENGINGFYFDQDDLEGFVSAISNWLENSDDFSHIGANASKKAYEMFSSERLVNDIENLYYSLLKEKQLKKRG